MSRPASPSAFSPSAALLSAIVPGLGQIRKHQERYGAGIMATTAGLLLATWGIGQVGGRGADIFFLMVIVLPWWVIQAYDAFLPTPPTGPTLRSTLRTVWSRAHDIRFLGPLFLLTALTDFYIIVANPAYALTVFCAKPTGLLGILTKVQSPTLHLVIGYGFLRLRRWSLLVYLAYAAFGLLNATANFACFGYGRVRAVFLFSLVVFTLYVFWRRDCFRMDHPAATPL